MKGFVDLQVNGYAGVDFSAPGLTLEQIRQVVRALLERGTAMFCPTVITSPREVYEQNLPVLSRAMTEEGLAPHLVGIHLEGPFISATEGARGAHDRNRVVEPDLGLLEHLCELAQDRVRLVTLAPELPHAGALIRHLKRSGKSVSLGHHLADAAAISRSCELGARASTHLGNGIPNTIARHPNPIVDQLDEDRLTAMLITDGHHIPDALIRVVLRVKGAERVVVV